MLQNPNPITIDPKLIPSPDHTIDPTFREIFTHALRSGNYKQVRYSFTDGNPNSYCAVGLAITLNHKYGNGSLTDLMSYSLQRRVESLNDAGYSFHQIADFLETIPT